jgi:O-antigen/teichoic acid export membrane protein
MSRTTEELSLTSQSTWLLFAKTVSFILAMILPLLVVRYLTAERVGVYRQAFLFATNASVILPLGFSMSAYYYLNRSIEKHSAAILNILLFNFVMGGVAFFTLLLFPQLLGIVFQNPELTRLAPLVGIIIWLWIFSGFLEVLALANREARLATVFIIGSQLSKTLLMVGAVVAFTSVEAFLYAATLQAVLQTILLFIYLNRRFPFFWRSFQWSEFRSQLQYALPFGFAAFLYTIQTDIHNYFVSYRFGPSEFAIYSQGCFQLPLIAILYESISSVVIPRMSQLQEEGKKREMLLISVSAMQKLALVYFPLFFFLIIVAEEFITTLFTQAYAASVPIFRVNLLLLPFFCVIVDPVGRAFAEVGKFLLKARAILFAGLLLALWFGIQRFDLTGIIAIVVSAVLLEKVVSVWKAFQMLEVRREDIYLLRNLAKTAIASAVAGTALLMFYLAIRTPLLALCIDVWQNALSSLGSQKAADFLGGCTFLGICFLFYASVYLALANYFGVFGDFGFARVVGGIRRSLRSSRSKTGYTLLRIGSQRTKTANL